MHLLLNHFPIVGLIFSFLVLCFGLIRSKKDFVQVALSLTVLSGALAIPTYLTGEPAEDVIKNLPVFSESIVEEHEKAGLFAVWAMVISAVASATGLFFSIKKNEIPKKLVIVIVVLHVWALSVVARTNYLGGKISHTEVR